MKRTTLTLLTVLTLASALGAATVQVWLPPAKYATEYTLYFAVEDSNNPHRVYETAPAAADVHVFQDGASEARATNAVTDLGRTFSLVLTAEEMTGKVIAVDVNDASAPPLFADAVFYIPTFGNAGAYHPFDYSLATAWDALVAEHTGETTFGGEVGGLDPNLTLVLADTAELQTDWTNGGRLDLILDAIRAMTDLMAVVTTTVADSNDANDVTLTAGATVDDAYWMHAIMVEDGTDGHSEVRWIEYYDAQRDAEFDEPLSFAPVAGDRVWVLGPVYGGLLYEIRSSLETSKAPIYYYKAGSSGSGPAGTTYLNESGEDP